MHIWPRVFHQQEFIYNNDNAKKRITKFEHSIFTFSKTRKRNRKKWIGVMQTEYHFGLERISYLCVCVFFWAVKEMQSKTKQKSDRRWQWSCRCQPFVTTKAIRIRSKINERSRCKLISITWTTYKYISYNVVRLYFFFRIFIWLWWKNVLKRPIYEIQMHLGMFGCSC